MDETASDTADQDVVRDQQLDCMIDLLLFGRQHGIELFSLWSGAREAIQNEPVTARPRRLDELES